MHIRKANAEAEVGFFYSDEKERPLGTDEIEAFAETDTDMHF